MELRYSATSPFARKVLVVAHEVGLASRITLVATTVAAIKPNADLARQNPLMKLPTLVTDDDQVLFDSPVICQYLDSLHGGRKLTPETGPTRWRALCLEALADGILDAAILCRNETNARPEGLRWQAWIDGQMTKVRQGLDMIEQEVVRFSETPDIGQIALGCCLGFLEFRGVGGDLRSGRPKLFAWFDRFARRPAMSATAPSG